MFHEERNDYIDQASPLAYAIRHPVSVVPSHDAAAEVRLQGVQSLNVALVLDDRELWENLYSHRHLVVAGYSDVETAFTIDETGNPLRFELHVFRITWSIPNV